MVSCKMDFAIKKIHNLERTHVHSSLVPRPSPAPVFDRLQYAYYYKRSKTGAGEGLGTRLCPFFLVGCVLQGVACNFFNVDKQVNDMIS